MKSVLLFLVITFSTINANAQLGDLFRKLGDTIDDLSKKNNPTEIHKSPTIPNKPSNSNELENKNLKNKFNPTEGQSLKKVNDNAYIYCNNNETRKKVTNDNFLIFINDHPFIDNVKIYKPLISTIPLVHNSDFERENNCFITVYFRDGKVINTEEIVSLENEYAQKILEQEKLKNEKIIILNNFISNNHLKLLNDFINVSSDKFRIYETETGSKFYSINNAIVDSSAVQSEINFYNAKKDTEKELAQKIQIENELKEKNIAEENRKRDELKRAESALNELIQKNELEVLYRNESFLITKNRSMKFIYIKNGKIQKPNDVKDDIDAYNNFITRQEKQKKESAELKQRNLSYRWVVQAQAVCSSDRRCWIKSVNFEGNDSFDGAAIFSISWESWKGSGGSSASTRIECGFNRSNSIRSTNLNAVCQ